jgi:hypothetical protein
MMEQLRGNGWLLPWEQMDGWSRGQEGGHDREGRSEISPNLRMLADPCNNCPNRAIAASVIGHPPSMSSLLAVGLPGLPFQSYCLLFCPIEASHRTYTHAYCCILQFMRT